MTDQPWSDEARAAAADWFAQRDGKDYADPEDADYWRDGDAVLAALAPHVVPRGPQTEEWEWGVRMVGGRMLRPTMTNEEGEARRSAIPEAGDKIVRRRPAGPWEEVDA